MLQQILYTACVTPFSANSEAIDYQSLERLLRMQEAASNGILLFGSTGESLSLTLNEKKEIMHFVADLKLKTEIIVGVPSYNLELAVEWIDFANQVPIQGYLITTPIYTKPGIMGQTKYFECLLEKATHPVMLYNIPGRAGVRLHPEAVKNLAHHPNFMAIKNSSDAVESLVDYKIAAPNIAVYCGDDYMMPAMAIEGACGLLSVASNAWPEATRNYVQNCLQLKQMEGKLWWQACRALFTASNPIPIKALLKDIGIIANDSVRLPLNMEDLPSRATLLKYHKQMEIHP